MTTFKNKAQLDAIFSYAKRYREKMVIVEALQIHEEMRIETGEGIIDAKPGDWLIREPLGDYDAMTDEAFKKTYCESYSPNEAH